MLKVRDAIATEGTWATLMGQTAMEAGSVLDSRHRRRVGIQYLLPGFKQEQLALVRLELAASTLLAEASLSFGASEELDFARREVVALA